MTVINTWTSQDVLMAARRHMPLQDYLILKNGGTVAPKEMVEPTNNVRQAQDDITDFRISETERAKSENLIIYGATGADGRLSAEQHAAVRRQKSAGGMIYYEDAQDHRHFEFVPRAVY